MLASNRSEIAVSSISFGETVVGLASRPIQRQRAASFFELLTVLPFDRVAAEIYGRLPFRRASFDRLIAAHALAVEATLVTGNLRDFSDVPDLRCENWLA